MTHNVFGGTLNPAQSIRHTDKLITILCTLPWGEIIISHLVAPYTPAHSVHSVNRHLMSEPVVSTVIGHQGFSYAALSIWNEISPPEICNSPFFASLRYIISHVPSLSSTTPFPPPLATAHTSDSAPATDYMHSINANIELNWILYVWIVNGTGNGESIEDVGISSLKISLEHQTSCFSNGSDSLHHRRGYC